MNISGQDLEKMEEMARIMRGKSEDEVVETLAALVNSGELGMSKERVFEMIRTIEPMLNSSQKRTLAKLLKMIR
ncbi:MAG: hypothetical protein GX974_00935 [Clostridiales bacterium]|nr:hypothetical protein [Clostridiales bacterium]